MGKLPISVFGGHCWWHVGTETSPAPHGCAALICLPKMQVSLAPVGTSTRLRQCHCCPRWVSGGMRGKIQPLNPTACLFVVSWLALCKYLYPAEPEVIARSSAMGVCDEPASASVCVPEIIQVLLCSVALSSLTVSLLFLDSVCVPLCPQCMVPFLIPLKIIDFTSWSFFCICFWKVGKQHLCMCPLVTAAHTACVFMVQLKML